MKFGKAAIITLGSNILIFCISILTSVLTSRVLGTYGKGIIGISNNIIGLFLVIIDLGIGSASIYFIGKYRDKVNEIVTMNIVINLLEFFIIFIMYLLSFKYEISVFKGLSNSILIATLITIPIISLKNALIGILLALDKIIEYNKVNIFFSVMNFILLSFFVTTTKSPFWVVISNGINNFIILSILLYIIFWKLKIRLSFDFKCLITDMSKYGVKTQLANLVQLLTYRIDIFLINYFLGISDVGIYSNSVSLAETMWQVPSTISTLLYPKISSSSDMKETTKVTNKITRISLGFIVICSVFLALISKSLILTLYGEAFAKSAIALVILLPGICLFSISKILSSSLSGMGFVEKNLLISIVTCIVTVLLDLILIPNRGINGASIASCISYSFDAIITLVIYKSVTKSSIASIIIITKEDLKEIMKKINLKKISKI